MIVTCYTGSKGLYRIIIGAYLMLGSIDADVSSAWVDRLLQDFVYQQHEAGPGQFQSRVTSWQIEVRMTMIQTIQLMTLVFLIQRTDLRQTELSNRIGTDPSRDPNRAFEDLAYNPP